MKLITASLLVYSATAFMGVRNDAVVGYRVSQVAGGASGFVSTLEGKKESVANVGELLGKSEMIATLPMSGLTVKQVSELRRALPESTVAKVVKNKLMARALEDSDDWKSASSVLKGSNLWFFIEDDVSGTFKAIDKTLKDQGKTETNAVTSGVIDGDLLTPDQVKAVAKLPSKLELYARIAGSIKAVPTKVARVIKAPNSKLARAIKLATEEKSDE